MRLRHVIYLGCSILLLVFTLAFLWEFGFKHGLLETMSGDTGRDDDVADHWRKIITATGIAYLAMIFPIWLLSRLVRERETIESDLRQREAWVTEAARIAKLGHYIWDSLEDRCLHCDEEFARILGVTREDYLANSATTEEDLNWVHPDDRERYRAAIEVQTQTGGGHLEVEYRIVRRDGKVRHILERSQPILDKIGLVVRTIGTIQDITERKQAEVTVEKARDGLEQQVRERTIELSQANSDLRREITLHQQAEEALRESEGRLKAIMDNAPVEIYLKDAEGRYMVINRHYEKLWGIRNESTQGQLPWQVHGQEDFVAASRAQDLAVLQSGEVIEQDDDVFIGDSLHTLHMIKFPIPGPNGEVAGLGAVATDVTERRRLQKLEKEFISSVSDELRSPLDSVTSALAAIRSGALGPLPETARSMIDNAQASCDRLVQCFDDVLDIERLRAEKFPCGKRVVDLHAVARDTLLGTTPYAAQKQVDLRLIADGANVEVLAEGVRLMQVMTNLLTNAVKVSPPKAAVELRLSRSDRRARVSVKDCGPGIPEDFRDRAFERIAPAGGAQGREDGDTGPRLSICKEIVEQHGGRIALETETGTGTTVYFELPLHGGEEQAEASAETPPQAQGAASRA